MSGYCLAESAIFEKVGDEMVILNMDNGQYYGLDGTGCRMLELLKAHGDVDLIVRRLVAEYDASADILRTDLLALIAQLQQHGLVKKGLGAGRHGEHNRQENHAVHEDSLVRRGHA